MQILYLDRAPSTKETLPDFREKCRVTRRSRVFRGLMSSQRTPGFWSVTSTFENFIFLIATTLRNILIISLVSKLF